MLILISCSAAGKPKPGFVEENIQFASAQQKLQVEAIERSGKFLNPGTVDSGKVKYIPMDHLNHYLEKVENLIEEMPAIIQKMQVSDMIVSGDNPFE